MKRKRTLRVIWRSIAHVRGPCPIINHPSSVIHPRAFTLIELLVVIAILALLMSILTPTLQRARRRAKAVACQGNLRQWSILYATYAAENEGHLPGWRDQPTDPGGPWWGWWGWGYWAPGAERHESARYTATRDIMLCPRATKPANPTGQGDPTGGTFLAWGWETGPGAWWYGHGSYGVNGWIHWWYGYDSLGERNFSWSTTDVKGAATIPVLLDSAWCWGGWYGASNGSTVPPPESDAVPTMQHSAFENPFCINRHDGYVNGVFLDWSVRKVGLKELWTLKWHKEYFTRGLWTKAGGVKPDDWPQWMRRFKNY
jgi:prepilin-type N-terminal cleavage/methylation domain-containing protein/prepilin-type processing-associated H-X9-DG protein